MNSLLRFSKRTLDSSFLRTPYPTNYSYLVSGSFQLLLWILFSFSVAVLVHYRTWLVFRISSRWEPYSGWKFDQPYSWSRAYSFLLFLTRLSLFVVPLFRELQVSRLRKASTLTTLLLPFSRASVCSVLLSFAITNSINHKDNLRCQCVFFFSWS